MLLLLLFQVDGQLHTVDAYKLQTWSRQFNNEQNSLPDIHVVLYSLMNEGYILFTATLTFPLRFAIPVHEKGH